MKSKKLLIIILIILLIASLGYIGYNIYKDSKVLKVTSATIFGEKISLKEGQYIYNLSLKKGKVKSINNGCENPFQIKTNIDFSAMQFLSEGETEAYIKIGHDGYTSSNDNYIQTYSYEFHVYFEEPLVIEEGCLGQ